MSSTDEKCDGLNSSLLRQVLIALAVALVSAAAGTHTTIPAVLIPALSSNTSRPYLSETQSTWFASMHALSAMVGSVAGGWLVHYLGPRCVLLFTSLPQLAGWVVMSIAPNFTILMVGRVLVGVCCGICLNASQVYLGEAASPELRGRLVCLSGLLNSLGCLLSYITGYLLPWRWVPLAPIAFFVLPGMISLMFGVPESPYWLMARHKRQQALLSLTKLRNNQQLAKREVELLSTHIEAQQPPLGLQQIFAQIRQVTVLVPLLSLCALFVCRVFSGIMPLIVYAVSIFEQLGDGPGETVVNAYESALIIGVVRLFDSLASVLYVSDRFGRRPLLMISGFVCAAATSCLGGFLLLRHHKPDWQVWSYLGWLPLFLMVVFLMSFDLGFARTGWVLQSELLPTRVRSAFSGLTVCTHFTSSFISVFVFPSLLKQLTIGGVFLLFSLFSCLGSMIVFLLIPETKHKRLEEIEEFYNRRFGRKLCHDPEEDKQDTKL